MDSSQSESCRQWLTDYLRHRASLASQDSDFHCDPACDRPGCKNPDLQIPVSLIDLLGASHYLKEPVGEIFRRHYILGLFCNDREDWLRTVTVRLHKPCPFLDNDLCGLYPVRPLPCMLFPEYLVSRGTFAAHAAKDQFREYLCLRRPLHLSPARAQAVAKLRSLFERELLISSYYLFNDGLCHIDFSNMVKEDSWAARIELPFSPSDETAQEGRAGLCARHLPDFPEVASPQSLQGSNKGGSSGKQEARRLITHQDLELIFGRELAGSQPFAGVEEKISNLDTKEGQAQFLQLFQDQRLYQKLRQAGDDRALVFQFMKGKFRARRRSIMPAEYKFY